ncbi:hypothetical protein M3Y99_00075100 [Aphelenchoides fujianensis]|nr:hypothetical protein M3Y99_00075100 [Aphelenchoides fujianensis]
MSESNGNQQQAESSDDTAHLAGVSDYFRDHPVLQTRAEERDHFLAAYLNDLALEMGLEFTSAHPERRPRVSQKTLEGFEVIKDEKKLSPSGCTVCLEEFSIGGEAGEIRQLPECRHQFHTKQKKAIQADIDELHDSMYS